MKAGLSIQALAKEIQRQKDASADYLVNTASLRMEAWGSTPMLHLRDDEGAELVEPTAVLKNIL